MRKGDLVTSASGMRYRVRQKLGEEVASTVYEAVEEGSSRPVMLKVLRPGVGRIIVQHFWQEDLILGFLAQAQEMAGDELSYVPRVLDRQREGLVHFLVLEMVTGTPLDRFLQKKVLAEDEALVVADQVLHVLEWLHEELRRSYTNFQLSNIWLQHDDEGRMIGVKMVNWSYVSDEWNSDGKRPSHFNPENDLARFGTFLYRMLSGKGADAQGETEYALERRAGKRWQTISLATRQMLFKALHPDSEQRFISAMSFRLAVQDVQALWEQDPVELASSIESHAQRLPDDLKVEQAERLLAAIDMIKRLGHSSPVINTLEERLNNQLDSVKSPPEPVESSPEALDMTPEEQLTVLLETKFAQGLKELTAMLRREPDNEALVHLCLEQAHRVLGLRQVQQAISLLEVGRLYAQVPLLADELEWAWKEALVAAHHERVRREKEFEREEERIRREYEEEEERLKREHEEEEQRRRREHQEEEDRRRRELQEEEQRRRRELLEEEDRKRLAFEEEQRQKRERHRELIERQKEERLSQERAQIANEVAEVIAQGAWYRLRSLIERIPVGSVAQDAPWPSYLQAIQRRFDEAILAQELPVAQELMSVLDIIDSAGAARRQQAYDNMMAEMTKARYHWAHLFVRRVEEQLHNLGQTSERGGTASDVAAALGTEIERLLPFVAEKELQERLRHARQRVVTSMHAQQAKNLLQEAENALQSLTSAELERAKSNFINARPLLLKGQQPTQPAENGLRAVEQAHYHVMPRVGEVKQALKLFKDSAKSDEQNHIAYLSGAKEQLAQANAEAKRIWQHYINDQPPTFARLEGLQKEIKLLEGEEERRNGFARIIRRTWIGTLMSVLLAAALIAFLLSAVLLSLNSNLRTSQREMQEMATVQQATQEAQSTRVGELKQTIRGMDNEMRAFAASANTTATSIVKVAESAATEEVRAKAALTELATQQANAETIAAAQQANAQTTATAQQANAEATAVAANTAVADAVIEVTAAAVEVVAEVTAVAVIEDLDLLPVPITLDEMNPIKYDIPILTGEMTGWEWRINETLPFQINAVENGPFQTVNLVIMNQDHELKVVRGTLEFSGSRKEYFVFTPEPNEPPLPPAHYSLALQGYIDGQLVSHSLPVGFSVQPAPATAILEQTRLRSEPIYHVNYMLDGENGHEPSPVEVKTKLEVFAKVPPPPNISPDSYLLQVRAPELSRRFYWIRYPSIPDKPANLSGITREQVEALPVIEP